jgi:hypothetical protein
MPKSSVAEHSLEWSQLLTSVGTNAEDVPYLADLTAELERVLESITALETERLALTARRQQITRDLENLKNRGRILAARVRSGLKTKYGFGSEKLTEFGIRPRRRRLRDQRAEEAVVEKITDVEPVS